MGANGSETGSQTLLFLQLWFLFAQTFLLIDTSGNMPGRGREIHQGWIYLVVRHWFFHKSAVSWHSCNWPQYITKKQDEDRLYFFTEVWGEGKWHLCCKEEVWNKWQQLQETEERQTTPWGVYRNANVHSEEKVKVGVSFQAVLNVWVTAQIASRLAIGTSYICMKANELLLKMGTNNFQGPSRCLWGENTGQVSGEWA